MTTAYVIMSDIEGCVNILMQLMIHDDATLLRLVDTVAKSKHASKQFIMTLYVTHNTSLELD